MWHSRISAERCVAVCPWGLTSSSPETLKIVWNWSCCRGLFHLCSQVNHFLTSHEQPKTTFHMWVFQCVIKKQFKMWTRVKSASGALSLWICNTLSQRQSLTQIQVAFYMESETSSPAGSCDILASKADRSHKCTSSHWETEKVLP